MDNKLIAVRFAPSAFAEVLRELNQTGVPHRVVAAQTIIMPATAFDRISGLSIEKHEVVPASAIPPERLAELRARRPLP